MRDVGPASILAAMGMAMNASMELIYRRAAEGTDPALPRELEDIVRAGFVRSGDRLYLVRPEHISPTPEEFDDFDAEGWVNKLHLDTETPPSDPSGESSRCSMG